MFVANFGKIVWRNIIRLGLLGDRICFQMDKDGLCLTSFGNLFQSFIVEGKGV